MEKKIAQIHQISKKNIKAQIRQISKKNKSKIMSPWKLNQIFHHTKI